MLYLILNSKEHFNNNIYSKLYVLQKKIDKYLKETNKYKHNSISKLEQNKFKKKFKLKEFDINETKKIFLENLPSKIDDTEFKFRFKKFNNYIEPIEKSKLEYRNQEKKKYK